MFFSLLTNIGNKDYHWYTLFVVPVVITTMFALAILLRAYEKYLLSPKEVCQKNKRKYLKRKLKWN